MSSERDMVREVKEAVRASEQGEREWREAALEDMKFLAGEDHWPADVAAARRAEGRPVLVVNRLPKFVNSVIGEYRLNQFQARVRAADDVTDPRTAELVEGLLRAIQYESCAKIAYRLGLANAVACGRGWVRVAREYETMDGWDQVIRIRPVPSPFSVYPDPRHLDMTLSDAAYVAIVEDIPEREFERRWPKAAKHDIDGTLGDSERSWYSTADKTIRVAEYWRRVPTKLRLLLVGDPGDPTTWRTVRWPKGEAEQSELVSQIEASGAAVVRERTADAHKITVSLVSGGGVLEEERDEPGQFFPLVPVYGETYVFDGRRRSWGIVRHAKDPQRSYNFQWTAAVEQVAMQPKAPYVLSRKEYEGNEGWWDHANKGNLPVLVYTPDPLAPGRPQRQPAPQIPSAALTLAQQAGQDLMETTGVYQASLGDKTSASEPGVAIQARRAAGSTVSATYQDNLALALEQVARVVVDLLPHVYDAERVVRILGESPGEEKAVRVNGDQLPDLTRGRYDVVVDVGAAYQTRREEAMSQLLESAKLLGPNAVLLLDKVYSYGDFPGRDELVERIKQIQAMMGFTEDGQISPQMSEQIQGMVAQMIQAAVPAPEQVQELVQRTVGEIHQRMGIQ